MNLNVIIQAKAPVGMKGCMFIPILDNRHTPALSKLTSTHCLPAYCSLSTELSRWSCLGLMTGEAKQQEYQQMHSYECLPYSKCSIIMHYCSIILFPSQPPKAFDVK